MASTWLTALQILVATIGLWLFTAYLTTSAFPTLKGKRILLLTAHPDDEAMFFAPTLRWLTNPTLQNQVILLCFSSGDAEGLGQTRKKELAKSALQLGITSIEHIVVIEDEKFPDSMTANWDPKIIGNVLQRYFAPKIAQTPSTQAPESYIDAIITFDSAGVSGHPNHTALLQGAHVFLKSLMARHSGWDSPTKLYALTTTNIVRKYTSIFDTMVTVARLIGKKKERGAFPTPLVVVSGPVDIFLAQRAMVTAHKSQMRWFRWGWIGLSRYMVVNDLVKQKIG